MNLPSMKMLARRVLNLRHRLKPGFRLIVDRERRLGNFEAPLAVHRTDLNKEEVSRDYVFAQAGESLNFLDVGARDGALTYLLGIRGNLKYDEAFYQSNFARFKQKYRYFGMDLLPADSEQVLSGDVCDPAYVDNHPQFCARFDVIYSNNVFEHLERPWLAAANLEKLLKPGGIIITVVPFAQRYHESPGDFFRYTHTGIASLFDAAGQFETLVSGYDIVGRRNNWQGNGANNDIVPVDNFGAWRETWYTLCIMKKVV